MFIGSVGRGKFGLHGPPCLPRQPLRCLPFIICELVSVVVGGNDVHKKNVLRFGIKAGHLHFVTGKHPPRTDEEETQRQRELMQTF